MSKMSKHLGSRSGEDLPTPVRLRYLSRSTCLVVAFAAGCGSPSTQQSSSGPGSAVAPGAVAVTPNAPSAGATASVGGVRPPAGAAGSGPNGPEARAASAAPVTAGAGGGPPPTGSVAAVDGSSDLPCAISQALASNCQKCHASEPVFGAPMPLVTLADLQKPSKTNPSVTVAQAAVKRLNDTASPMPPGANITADERKELLDYLTDAKAPVAAAGEKCVISQTRSDEYLHLGLTAGPGETCYDFVNHNGQTPDDKAKYVVKAGEHYEEFLFKVPWGPGMVATKFGSKLDNIKVAHHWLFFSTNKTSGEGSHTTTIGTVLGEGATLLAGWAVGGDNVVFPPDMGLELPASGILNAQWHYYNQGKEAAPDASAVQICVMPAAMKKNVAGITWLGTENFNGLAGMPAHMTSKFEGTCKNDSDGPITIWGFTPHQHKLGRHTTAVIHRKDGKTETVFDRAFDFGAQITYAVNPLIVLDKGESITSTCTYDNITDSSVAYGPSSDQEMCYLFTVSYPLGALNNGVTGLNGALNNCW
jgi:hypothetical protein